MTALSVLDANVGIYVVRDCAGEEGRHRWASMGYVLDLIACSCCSTGHHKFSCKNIKMLKYIFINAVITISLQYSLVVIITLYYFKAGHTR